MLKVHFPDREDAEKLLRRIKLINCDTSQEIKIIIKFNIKYYANLIDFYKHSKFILRTLASRDTQLISAMEPLIYNRIFSTGEIITKIFKENLLVKLEYFLENYSDIFRIDYILATGAFLLKE